MLFTDRLEVWNPGQLTHSLSLAKLRGPHGSFPVNPLLAEPMYLTGYIERIGSGTSDMIRISKAAHLKEPDFLLDDGFKTIVWRPEKDSYSDNNDGSTGEAAGEATGEATGEISEEIRRVVFVLEGELRRTEIQKSLDLKHDENFRLNYLTPALEKGFIEMTHPDSPTHPEQRYRLSKKGVAYKNANTKKKRKK